MTEKTIIIEKLFESIADTIFVLDNVSKEKVVEFLKNKALEKLKNDKDIEKTIVHLIRYCVEAKKTVLEDIKNQ